MIWPEFAFRVHEYASTKPDWEWRTTFNEEPYLLIVQFFTSGRPRLYLFRHEFDHQLYYERFATDEDALTYGSWIRENLPSFLMELVL